jgi:microcompartment protein CcmK/EutM
MPVDLAKVEWALVAMSVAGSLQTMLLIGMVVGAYIAWQRMRQLADEQLAVLHNRIDEVARDVKTAARAVDRVAERTGNLVLDTGNAVRTAAPPWRGRRRCSGWRKLADAPRTLEALATAPNNPMKICITGGSSCFITIKSTSSGFATGLLAGPSSARLALLYAPKAGALRGAGESVGALRTR